MSVSIETLTANEAESTKRVIADHQLIASRATSLAEHESGGIHSPEFLRDEREVLAGYVAAAQALLVDYSAIEVAGFTYWALS